MAGFIDSVSATYQVSFPIPRFLFSAIAPLFGSIGGFSCSLVSSIARSCKQRRFLETLGEEEIGVDNKERDKEQLVAVFLLPSQVCTCLATFLSSFF